MANATGPGIASEVFGQMAYTFTRIQPYIKTEVHTILAALFPIFIGAHASLSRPSTAAKPERRQRAKKQPEDVESSEEEEEDTFQRMEGFSKSDALWLPLFAGATLGGLYLLIKYLKDLNLLNLVLNYYFSSVGVFSVCKLLADGINFVHSLVFPKYYSDGSGVWLVDGKSRKATNVSGKAKVALARTTPLPGLPAHLPLPQKALDALWTIRELPRQKLTFKFYIHRLVAARFHLSPLSIIGVVFGLAATAYYNFVDKTWWLTNLLGFAFSYSALQLMSPTSFDTGSLILAALFVYDIVMVFYTPLMVTVAKSLDVPIKLLIPREADKDGIAQFAMLGLGDVVLPGMMIAMALRFDLYLHYLRLQRTAAPSADSKEANAEVVKAPYVAPSGQWSNQFWTRSWVGTTQVLPAKTSMGSFTKTYFWTSIVGYIVAMITTLFVMITWQHAQPALLYLVPGVLISLWGMAAIKGDLKHMWQYTEEELDESAPKDKNGDKKSSSGESIFSASKSDRNSKKMETALGKMIEHGSTDDEGEDEDKREKSKEKVEAVEKSMGKDISKDLFYFGISRYAPKSKKQGKVNWVSSEDAAKDDEHGRKRQRTK